MNFVIAIPTYKRYKILKKKTLNLLKNSDVPQDIIYIFVADEEEKTLYLNEIGTEYKIIVGKPTIQHQRNFINDFFELNQRIISLDDDLSKIVSGYRTSTTEQIKLEIPSLMNVFKKGFDDCELHKSYIFGFYPCDRIFYMTNVLSTKLTYIIASAYGYINRRINCSTNDKEDFERSLQYYLRDGVVLRYNYIGFTTRYYTEKGGLQETRTLETIKAGAEYIHNKYPDYTKLKIKKNGRYEIVFNKKIPDITTYKITESTDTIQELLNKTTLPKLMFSKKINKPERGDKLFEIEEVKKIKSKTYKHGDKSFPRTANLGFGFKREQGFGILSDTIKYQELYNLLVEFGKKIIPSHMTFNAITINRNMKCKKHKDTKNVGASVFFTIGNYTGGGLYVEKKLYNHCNENIIIFNGAEKEHYTEEFEGERYSFIYYNVSPEKCPEEFIYRGTR